jgi:imidazole glycerol-phosphate synthase subunit HisF
MVLPRIIPILLLKGTGIVKGKKFKGHQYVGDPLNAVHIFNKKQADELIILDISASSENRCISPRFVAQIAYECMMPLTVGGGISNLEQASELLSLGAEKITLNSHWVNHPELVTQIAKKFGSQSVVVAIDIKKNFWGQYHTFIRNGTKKTGLTASQLIKMAQDFGAGEILLNAISHDGMMNAYDWNLLEELSPKVHVPLIISGGASSMDDFKKAIQHGASACAAGSMFVYHGPRRAVLISYPDQAQLDDIYQMHRKTSASSLLISGACAK